MIERRFLRVLATVLATALVFSIWHPVQAADKPNDVFGKKRVIVTGRGVVLVSVDPSSGQVTAARMLKSTGSKVLDDAAVTAFQKSKHRFKPGTPARVEVPITFTLSR
jgi:TonB family protein